MSDNNLLQQVDHLIIGLQQTDPRLYEALKAMSQEIKLVYDTLYPVQLAVRRILAPPEPPSATDSFTAVVGPEFIVLNWDEAVGARFYELRRGSSWDTATFITKTPTLSATLDPLPEGEYTFLLKSINSGGIYQAGDPSSVIIDVLEPGLPSVTGQVIDNNVLLFWEAPDVTSFRIRSYNVYKNGVLVGIVNGTFISFFEMLAGDYEYSVSAIDIAGNEGLQNFITLNVNQPPDFELQYDFTSIFDGTKTNCLEILGGLLVCINTTETWDDHFTTNLWNTIQDQISAGYPIYIQPGDSSNTAQYQEVIDLGAVIENIIFSVLTAYTLLSGNLTTACQIEYKVAGGDPWTVAPVGFSAFIPQARYFRVTLDFTATDQTALLLLTTLRFIADVKQEVDSGQVNALAADAGGTVVSFNKDFVDVKSITATAGDTVEVTVVVDFLDVPNPTDFKVLAFDSAGARTDVLIYWKARGIV